MREEYLIILKFMKCEHLNESVEFNYLVTRDHGVLDLL